MPQTYFRPLGPDGRRDNFAQSPELFTGTVEFLANEDYASRAPKEPTYFFLIDVSRTSVANLVPTYALAAVKELLRGYKLNGEKRAAFYVALFDTQLHLLQIRDKKPTLITLDPSVQAPYRLPPDRLITFLDTLEPEDIDSIIDKLVPSLGFSNSEATMQSIEEALRYATDLMASQGGKVSLILGNEEAYAPKANDGDPAKRNFFNANDQAVAKVAVEMHKWLISMDLYLFGQNKYKNLASLGEGVRLSGGDCCYYLNNSQTELTKFYNDLLFNCSKNMTWESVFRLRCNTGWKKRILANTYGSVGNDLTRPEQTDENYTVLFIFEEEAKSVDNRPNPKKDVFFIQTSLLYTNHRQQRVIRVHNYCIPLTTRAEEVYQALDYQAVTAALVRASS